MITTSNTPDAHWRNETAVQSTGSLRLLLPALERDAALYKSRADFVRSIIKAEEAEERRKAGWRKFQMDRQLMKQRVSDAMHSIMAGDGTTCDEP